MVWAGSARYSNEIDVIFHDEISHVAGAVTRFIWVKFIQLLLIEPDQALASHSPVAAVEDITRHIPSEAPALPCREGRMRGYASARDGRI